MIEWVKAFHVIAVIAWMAGLFYLPRLFVYHSVSDVGSQQSETFKVMERRLLRAIMTPAMVAVWGLGLWLAALTSAWDQGWFSAKMALVILLSGFHGLCARWTREFARDARKQTQRFYRFVNEVPALLMIAIVILAIVKPF